MPQKRSASTNVIPYNVMRNIIRKAARTKMQGNRQGIVQGGTGLNTEEIFEKIMTGKRVTNNEKAHLNEINRQHLMYISNELEYALQNRYIFNQTRQNQLVSIQRFMNTYYPTLSLNRIAYLMQEPNRARAMWDKFAALKTRTSVRSFNAPKRRRRARQ
jgi:hypothetical protein